MSSQIEQLVLKRHFLRRTLICIRHKLQRLHIQLLQGVISPNDYEQERQQLLDKRERKEQKFHTVSAQVGQLMRQGGEVRETVIWAHKRLHKALENVFHQSVQHLLQKTQPQNDQDQKMKVKHLYFKFLYLVHALHHLRHKLKCNWRKFANGDIDQQEYEENYQMLEAKRERKRQWIEQLSHKLDKIALQNPGIKTKFPHWDDVFAQFERRAFNQFWSEATEMLHQNEPEEQYAQGPEYFGNQYNQAGYGQGSGDFDFDNEPDFSQNGFEDYENVDPFETESDDGYNEGEEEGESQEGEEDQAPYSKADVLIMEITPATNPEKFVNEEMGEDQEGDGEQAF